MRFILLISSGIASVIAGCGNPSVIEISNTIDEARKNEIVEIPMAELSLPSGRSFMIRDASGAEMPYQITYDSLLIFPATVAPLATAVYYIEEGVPATVDTAVSYTHLTLPTI